MGYDNSAFGKLNKLFRYFIKPRSIFNHLISYASQVGYEIRNIPFRIDKSDKLIRYRLTVMLINSYFSYLL